jgi:hypothetical protein
MQLPPDWSEFLSALKRHGVRFLLVGAHALAAHGRPRATQDLDVLIAPTAANARKVVAALAEFGFAEFAGDWRWFTKPYRVTMASAILSSSLIRCMPGVSDGKLASRRTSSRAHAASSTKRRTSSMPCQEPRCCAVARSMSVEKRLRAYLGIRGEGR